MRRSICYTEPNMGLSGEIDTWKFCYTTSTPLPKGTKFKFDLQSKGRDIDWQIPQTNPKDKKNLIWVEMPGGKALAVKALANQESAFEFALPLEIKAGETLGIFLGTPEKAKEEIRKKGNRAQTNVQRRRPFYLYIDPKGKGDYRDPEIFTLDVRGNVLNHIRIVAPSLVSKNKRFDVIIRFEDVFGNLTSNAPEGTLIELSYENLRENLNWKLFVPETGFINVPNLYFNEPGMYKIQLLNLKTNEKYFSAPIKCFADIDKNIYWGLLHGESEKFDAVDNIEACLRYFRDEKNNQFFATSPFENSEETSNEAWKAICTQIAEFNEEHRFTTILGFQLFANTAEEGLRQLLYFKDNKPILRKKDAKTNNLKKIYKSHSPKEILAIPCFTMAKGFQTTFEDFTPEFERVVEIYNSWGSSECTAKEGNSRPITSKEKSGIFETEKGSLRKALNANCRFGFVAGGLDDRGIYSGFYESEQVQYSPGLTAILAIEQTREALMQALINRSCYATTGERIIVGFTIAGAQMGCELNTKAKPGLAFNRHIVAYVAGTSSLKEVTIIRNGIPCHTVHPKNAYLDMVFDDTDPITKVLLNSSDDRPPFVYYYLRVVQDDGHIAWSSPIWIDHTDTSFSTVSAKVAGVKKARKNGSKQ
ncbi:MAG TPA: DUF3604 domain-containing protein [Rhabdochlamydiaceae bacterium]|nr:DUF3604 domain-containing protein [Rhabdochlamydiaceae bacterium]